jgi:hypothetical protein
MLFLKYPHWAFEIKCTSREPILLLYPQLLVAGMTKVVPICNGVSISWVSKPDEVVGF